MKINTVITIDLQRTAISIFVLVACLLLLILTAFSAPGDLDRTFSGDGKLTDLIPGQNWNRFMATVVQPDGKIVAVGGTSGPRYFYVARYNVDGSPDKTFGGRTGKVAVQFGRFYNYVTDVALQPDGKIVLAGCYCEEDFGDYTLALARLNSDGSLDTTFDGDGILTWPYIVGSAEAVAIQNDGKIVVAGWNAYSVDFLVMRFNIDGSQDTTFTVNGNVFTSSYAYPHTVAIQNDGRIVAAGRSFSDFTATAGDFALVRYNSDGSLDTTFDGDGIVTTPIGPASDVAQSVALQADGKIVAAGTSDRVGPDFTVVRYNPNGSLDSTFDGDGIVNTQIGVEADATSVAIQTDGKIVAAGSCDTGLGGDFALVRYNPHGSLDTTFGGGDGKVTANFSTEAGAKGMALDGVGRAIVVGESDGKFAIARFLLAPTSTHFDFDGDGRSDTSVFRPSEGKWYLNRSKEGINVVNWGLSGDVIAPADFDGDGKTDTAVFRPSNGNWYIINSATNTFDIRQWGLPGDIPVPGDYDGYSNSDMAVFRPSEAKWYVRYSNGTIGITQFGSSGDLPVPADFDGDGDTDLATFHKGQWQIARNGGSTSVANWGLRGDLAVPADYDGDGKTDLAVFRPSNGRWYIINSSNQQITETQWGLTGDVPVPGDYDGDGTTDFGVYRNGQWYLMQSTAGIAVSSWGLAGDVPISAAN